MRASALLLSLLFAGPALAQGLGQPPAPAGGFQSAPIVEPPVQPKPEAAVPAPDAAPPQPVVQPKSAAKPKPKKKKPAAPVNHDGVVARNDPMPSLYPGALAAIEAAAERYRAIAAAGGWPILPKGAALRQGSSGALVVTLRQRLAAEGDTAEAGENEVFDVDLARAVKRFQARHGQSQTGIVDGATLAALRVPAETRAHRLGESARRLAQKDFAFGRRYVVVNIPSASVEAVENERVERRHIAVVGKQDRASPEVETRITNINFNPTWTVPVSIIRKDIIPKMRADPSYLAKAKIRIFGASGAEIDPTLIDWKSERATAFTLRQDAGSSNALGEIRIDMPNRQAVYMHDTPSKRLFARDDRFHSSGCVRVHDVRGLVGWLLDETPGPGGKWDSEAIAGAIEAGKRKDIRLKEPVPVIWTYLTGYVTPDGLVHFRNDVYGLDELAILAASSAEQPADAKPAQLAAPSALGKQAAPQPRAAGAPGLAAPASRPASAPRAMLQRIDPN